MGQKILVLVSLLVSQFCILIDAQFELLHLAAHCTDAGSNYTKRDDFENNLGFLFDNLTSQASSLRYYNYSVGDGSDIVYGLFQCQYNVGLDVCNACVSDARKRITLDCPLYREAIVWYWRCMLRFGNRNFFSLNETSPAAYMYGETKVEKRIEFDRIFENAMIGAIKDASNNPSHVGFSKTNWSVSEEMFAIVECNPYITSSGCDYCLRIGLDKLIKYVLGSVIAIVVQPSCELRYNTTGATSNDLVTPPPASPPSVEDRESQYHTQIIVRPGSSKAAAYIAIGASCAVFGLLVLLAILCIFMCRKRSHEASNNASQASQARLHRVESDERSLGEDNVVYYDFATLKAITEDFSDENKLGEGGFGCVYKGTLVDGERLAIKRLSDSSGQGSREFKAEARFLAKLQHRNLVKLIGFCSEGEEKLLVYEFMSNSSLDGFLFDRENHPLLNWVTRNQTIVGIAQGLQYLHSDSRFTIIHRDLKPENILMDDEMNPKIADFGLARLFERTQKYGNTIHIAGTRGYMAPECMSGEYSSKSDVYSFGVMVLEIVFGHRMFKHNSPDDLLINAWRLWDEGRGIELVDPELDESYSNEDIKRCIQIGFLCVQARAEQRPTMKDVVLMLIVGEMVLPLPSPPMMSFPQFYMPRFKTGEQPSESDIYSTKSTTDDLHPKSNAR